jgi:two-component sensor histidine kinase
LPRLPWANKEKVHITGNAGRTGWLSHVAICSISSGGRKDVIATLRSVSPNTGLRTWSPVPSLSPVNRCCLALAVRAGIRDVKTVTQLKAPMTERNDTSPPKVLVVEDEMVLRMRAVDIVEDAGFTPVQAVDADQALSILEARSDISLLFTDIQMPGSMDGLKLAHAVRQRWPTIKIILVSGQVRPSAEERPTDSRFFGKPLVVSKMVSELQDMVGGELIEILAEPLARSSPSDLLSAENDGLRLLLEQAAIDAKALVAQAGIEAREREAADNLQNLVLGELQHRIKNTFATVSAIASQSLRDATSLDHAKQAVEGRLVALGRAHDLLMQGSWSNASFNETLRGAIDPYSVEGADRLSLTGPDLNIVSGAVIALAMTLNELCTNATKFGAWSVPGGSVGLRWGVNEQTQRFNLTWSEKSGPKVEQPVRRGFGTRMIESLGQQLKGEVRLSYLPAGFVYELDVPRGSVIAAA